MSSKTSRSRRLENKCDELLDIIRKRLKYSSPTISDKFSDIGKAWAAKLRDLPSQQAVHAEKLINDIFYEAQLANLNRNFTLSENAAFPSGTIQTTANIFSNFNSNSQSSTQPPSNSQPPFSSQEKQFQPKKTSENTDQENTLSQANESQTAPHYFGELDAVDESQQI